MNLRKLALNTMGSLIASLAMIGPASAADRPYTEGTVSQVTAIRTEPGRFDDYLAWLAGPYKQLREAEKAAGIIVSYTVYQATPRGPNDPDLYLVETYKNMAALDDLNAKTDPIAEKQQGSQADRNKAMAERSKLRTILGSQIIRNLGLK